MTEISDIGGVSNIPMDDKAAAGRYDAIVAKQKNADLESDKEAGSQASSGYDSGTMSPSTTGSNSPRTADESQNDANNEESDVVKLDIEETVNSSNTEEIPKLIKKRKTFPVLKRMKVTPSSNEPGSSSDNDNEHSVSNIPLSQRLKTLNKNKKKTLIRLRVKQSKADREILNEMDNPKASTSGPLIREMERIRRSLLAQAEGKSPSLQNNSISNFKRITPRKPVGGKSTTTTPLLKSPTLEYPIKKQMNGLTPRRIKRSVKTSNLANGKEENSTQSENPKICGDRQEIPEKLDNEATFANVQQQIEHSKDVISTTTPSDTIKIMSEIPNSEETVSTDASENDNKTSDHEDVKVNKKTTVHLQRLDQSYVDLLVTQQSKQNESKLETVSTVSGPGQTGQIGKSIPKKRKKISSSSSSRMDSEETPDIKAILSKRLVITIQRLDSDSDSTKTLATLDPESDSAKTNSNQKRRNSRKRKVCPVSEDSELTDTDVDIEACSEDSESNQDDTAVISDGSESELVDVEAISAESDSDIGDSKKVNLPKSKRTVTTTTHLIKQFTAPSKSAQASTKNIQPAAPKRKIGPKCRTIGDINDSDNHSSVSVAVANGLQKPTTLNGNSHSRISESPHPSHNVIPIIGRRLSTRTKKLKIGDDFIY